MAEYQRWYRAGTASVANGATAVTGLTTAWLANAKPGDQITFDGGAKWYEIASVETNTGLTLGTAFAETTVSGGAYAIGRSGPAWGQVADVALQFAALIDSQTDIFSGVGIPSNALGANGSVYIQTDTPKFYKKAAGVWDAGVSIVGPVGPIGPGFNATSTTSLAIGAGSKAFTIGTGYAYAAGMRARATATSDPTKWVEGIVASYTGGVLTLTVDLVGGTGTFASWTLNTAGDRGAVGATGPSYAATSAMSLLIATGSKVFATQAGLAYVAGSRVRAASLADPSNFMEGVCTAYAGTSLTLNVDLVGGAGTLADWNLSLAGQRGATGASYAASSTTSRTPAAGPLTFTIQPSLAIVVGSRLRGASAAAPASNWIEGVVTAYSGTSLTLNVDLFAGAVAVADWNFSLAGERGAQGVTGSTGSTGATGATGAAGPNTGLDYAFDTSVTDSDPGNGDIRLNSLAWGSGTFAYVSKTGRNGEALGPVIAALCGSSNTHRAHLRLFPVANRAIYLEAEIEAVITDGGAYWKLPLSGVVASAAMPAAGDVMSLVIDRSGDAASADVLVLAHAAFGGI